VELRPRAAAEPGRSFQLVQDCAVVDPPFFQPLNFREGHRAAAALAFGHARPAFPMVRVFFPGVAANQPTS